MNLALAIRVAIVTWIATFLATVLWHLPWFVFLSSCCALIVTGVLIAARYHGAERREGLIYVTAGLAFSALVLFLAPDAPFINVDIVWFFVVFFSLSFITILLLLLPNKPVGNEKTKSK
jgi:hypothetical protein